MRIGFKYNVKFATKRTTSEGKKFTTMSLGEKIKGTGSYINYAIAVWGEHLDIRDCDKIEIVEIEEINCVEKNGKRFYNVSARVKVIPEEEVEFATDDGPVVVDHGGKKEYAEPVVIEDDDTPLPFDL